MVNGFFKFLLLILFSNFLRFESFAQEDTTGFSVQFHQIQEICIKINQLEDLILLDSLLMIPQMSDPKVLAMIYIARAEKRWDLIFYHHYFYPHEEGEELRLKLERDEVTITEIKNDFDSAILLCPQCAVEYQYRRFVFLKDLVNIKGKYEIIKNNFMADYKSDYQVLKSIGYKENKVGVGVGVNAFRGKENWIGLEISTLTFSEPLSRLKYKSIKDSTVQRFWINEIPVQVSLFTIGYNFSLISKSHDIHFGLEEITSPVHFNILKFGVLLTDYSPKMLGYYRPEIGFGFGKFSIYYAYNLVFKKSMREFSEKHLLGIKIKFLAYRLPNNKVKIY